MLSEKGLCFLTSFLCCFIKSQTVFYEIQERSVKKWLPDISGTEFDRHSASLKFGGSLCQKQEDSEELCL